MITVRAASTGFARRTHVSLIDALSFFKLGWESHAEFFGVSLAGLISQAADQHAIGARLSGQRVESWREFANSGHHARAHRCAKPGATITNFVVKLQFRLS
jgi:hypothetical protein